MLTYMQAVVPNAHKLNLHLNEKDNVKNKSPYYRNIAPFNYPNTASLQFHHNVFLQSRNYYRWGFGNGIGRRQTTC